MPHRDSGDLPPDDTQEWSPPPPEPEVRSYSTAFEDEMAKRKAAAEPLPGQGRRRRVVSDADRADRASAALSIFWLAFAVYQVALLGWVLADRHLGKTMMVATVAVSAVAAAVGLAQAVGSPWRR